MLSAKLLSTLVSGVVGGAILFTFGRLLPEPPVAHAARTAAAFVQPTPGANGVTTAERQQDLDHAVATFKKLIPASGTSSPQAVIPSFNVAWLGWYTKCDVGLLAPNCTPTVPGKGLDASCIDYERTRQPEPVVEQMQAKNLLIDALLKGFEKPLQSEGGKQPDTKEKDKLPSQAFASVLYNLPAACYLRKIAAGKSLYQTLQTMLNNHSPGLGGLSLLDGAIVVKVIWEPTSPTFKLSDKPHIGTVPGDLSALPPESLKDSMLDGSLPPISQWLVAGPLARIDYTPPSASCGPPTGASPNFVYPESCFSYLPLADYRDKYKDNLKGILLPDSEALKHDPAYLVLVGVNVMEFNSSRYPKWLWSSFWWAQEQGTRFTGMPRWEHFHVCAIRQERAEAFNQQDVCFNPYLEGTSPSLNGLVSNCLTCHKSAGFKPDSCDSPSSLPMHTNAGICLGSPNDKGNPPTGCPVAISPEDFAGALTTHFLWSVGDAVNPTPGPGCPK